MSVTLHIKQHERRLLILPTLYQFDQILRPTPKYSHPSPAPAAAVQGFPNAARRVPTFPLHLS